MEEQLDYPRQPPLAATVEQEAVRVVSTDEFLRNSGDAAEASKKRDKGVGRQSEGKTGGNESGYDVEVSDLPENTLALFHNALRHEISSYKSYANDMLGMYVPKGRDDPSVKVLLDKWGELSRFMVLVSRIEEVIANAVFRDVRVGFRREAMELQKTHRLICERVEFAFELFVRATNRAAAALEGDPTMGMLGKFGEATEKHTLFAEDTAKRCEQFVKAVNELGEGKLRYPKLECEVWDTLQKVCRQQHFSFTAVQLFRWSANDTHLLRWMSRHTSSKSQLMDRVESWVHQYTGRVDDDSATSDSDNTPTRAA